jgi:hypothetical protein
MLGVFAMLKFRDYMDKDFNFEFKDKEIEKITADITKESRREFGRTFKSAAETAEKERGRDESLVAPGTDIGSPVVTGNAPLSYGATPAGAIEMVMPTSPEQMSTQATAQTPAESTMTAVPKYSPSVSDDHEATVAPVLSPSLTANDDEKELYAIAKPLRTYERDIADAIREKNESVASINLAAQVKRQTNEKSGGEPAHRSQAEKASCTGLVVLLSLILVLASASFVGVSYYFYSINKPTEIVETSTSIIAADTHIDIDITDLKNDAIVSEIKKALAHEGSTSAIVEIKLLSTQTDNEQNEIVTVMPIGKFFELFGRSAQPALARALGAEWMIGFQKQNGLSEPFILTRVQSFDASFGGMLDWEKNMLANLLQILPKTEVVGANLNAKFSDTIIRNKDVRVLKDSFGNTMLMYSFLDTKNLLIATNEQTFREVLGRFFSSQIVR